MNTKKQINIFAEYVENDALEQFYKAMALPQNLAGALMPDAHTGYTLPIGSVIKSKETIFPSYVGYDIGCGVVAQKLNMKYTLSELQLKKIKQQILLKIPIGVNTHKNLKNFKEFNFTGGSNFLKEMYNKIGKYSLGTLGGGNHFIEMGVDEQNYIWIIIHSGSRNLGYKIAEFYMKEAAIKNADETRYIKEFKDNNKWRDRNPEKFDKIEKEFVYRRVRARLNTKIEGHYGLNINTEAGKQYIEDMNICLEYALENRKRMAYCVVDSIEEVLNIKIEKLDFINRNHNHAEVKDKYVIHRKGATQADKGMFGVIPGNMKDGSFIVKGKGYEPSLNSSSHGAGRILSRRKAKDSIKLEDLYKEMDGIVNNITKNTIDESPKAYKNIFDVMKQQQNMVEVICHIKPILNLKG